MKDIWMYNLLGILAGFLITLQPGLNSIVSQKLGSPLLAAFISFLVGTLVLLLIMLILKIPFPDFFIFKSVPWWAWTGGILGAFLVTVSIILAPRIGALSLMVLFLVGQTLGSLLCDHFGLAGFPVHPLNIFRVIGLFFLFGGLYLINKF